MTKGRDCGLLSYVRRNSVECRDVLGDRVALQLAQLGGDGMHDRVVVVPFTGVELFELILDVARMLAGETRQLRRAEALRPVAAGAAGQAGELVAALKGCLLYTSRCV